MVGLMYHIPAAAHEDNPATEILSMVLGESPSGRLYKAIVEKKKGTSVEVMVGSPEDGWTRCGSTS